MANTEKLVTLDNGAVILTRKFPGSKAAHVQWSVVGGSYAERPDEHGVAHFLEHTLVDLDRLYTPIKATGGKVNAYTSFDNIAMWARVMPEHLADTRTRLFQHGLLNPTFSKADFDREFGPIKMEITESMSDPFARLYYNTAAVMHAGEPRGHFICGTHADLDTHSFEKLRRYFARVSAPRGLIALCAGNIRPAEFTRFAEKSLRDMPPVPAVQIAPSHFKSGEAVFVEPPSNEKLTPAEQPVTLIARFQAVPVTSELRVAFGLLCTMMTSGLDSPLMVELRKKRGLVYGVSAGLGLWDNDGNVQVRLDTSRSNIEQATEVLADTLANVGSYLTSERFEQARRTSLFNLADGEEDSQSWAKRAVGDMRVFGHVRSDDEFLAPYQRVSLAQVKQAAEMAFGKSPFVAAQGPLEGLSFKPVFDKALKLSA